MADRLIFSLQASPFFIFPSSSSSLHLPCHFSRRFACGSRSFQLQLANSTSPSSSSSSSSAPEELELVSTTQIKEGVHIFRFGDASEVKRYLEIEAKERFLKQHVKLSSEKEAIEEVSELESPKEKSNVKKSIETGSVKEDAPASLSNVIKIKDRKRVRSNTKRKKESVVSRGENKAEVDVATVSNVNSIVSVSENIPINSSNEEVVVVSEKSEAVNENEANVVESLSSEVMEEVSVNETRDCEVSEAIPTTSSTEEKEVVVVSEKSEAANENETSVESHNVKPLSSQVMKKVSVNEIRDCEVENRVEVQERPRSSTSEHGLKELDDSIDAREKPMETFEVKANLVFEPTVRDAAMPPDELVSTSEAHHGDGEIAEMPVVDISEAVNNVGNVASTTDDEVTVSDTKADNGSVSKTANDTESENLQLPTPETVGPESIDAVSDREELVSKAFYLESGFASLESPVKALTGREDAHFISHNNWLGVADGVSQWSFDGINRGTFAEELMSNCRKIVSDETDKITDPVRVLHKSVNETKSSGSSTALIAHLDNNELHIANIGDSGFIVIRNGTISQKSSPMFHHFGFPFQIMHGDDISKSAEVYQVNIEEGDVIITATDGLFDNLYEREIVSIVCESLEQSFEPQKIAELVAAKAQEVGRSETERRTPYADAAKEEGYDGHNGGKLDAVTVIVSHVKALSL